MAKRKSKTGKQKQAKAAGKKFGVSVKKGRDQPKITMLSASTSTTVVAKKQDGGAATNNNKMGDIKTKGFTPFPHRNNKKNMSKKLNRNQKKNGHHNPTNNAFGKEMQSAQERSWVQHSRDKEKKNRSMPSFAPATLIVDDHKKSTQRLMEEATTQVSTGMQGIGAGLVQQVRQDYPTSFGGNNQLQVLAAQYQSEEQPSLLETNNPWAALDQGDSDDEEEQMAKAPPAPKLFQFAPPSFAVGDDVDPDL
jgi:hypothetical protein